MEEEEAGWLSWGTLPERAVGFGMVPWASGERGQVQTLLRVAWWRGMDP